MVEEFEIRANKFYLLVLVIIKPQYIKQWTADVCGAQLILSCITHSVLYIEGSMRKLWWPNYNSHSADRCYIFAVGFICMYHISCDIKKQEVKHHIVVKFASTVTSCIVLQTHFLYFEFSALISCRSERAEILLHKAVMGVIVSTAIPLKQMRQTLMWLSLLLWHPVKLLSFCS